MKRKEFIVDQSLGYVSPLCTVMTFESEGILCLSGGAEGEDYGNDGDLDFTDR